MLNPGVPLGLFVEGGTPAPVGAAAGDGGGAKKKKNNNNNSNNKFTPVVVNSFPDGSLARQQGVKPGDVLASVNGEALDGLPLQACMDVLSRLKNEQRVLVLRRPAAAAAAAAAAAVAAANASSRSRAGSGGSDYSDSAAPVAPGASLSRQLHADFDQHSAAAAARPPSTTAAAATSARAVAASAAAARTPSGRRLSIAVMSDDSDDEYRHVGAAAMPVITIVVRTRPDELLGLSLNTRRNEQRDLRQLGRLFVDGLTPGSLAAREGVVVGDTLTQLNGRDVREAVLDELNELLLQLPSDRSKELEFQRRARSAAEVAAHNARREALAAVSE